MCHVLQDHMHAGIFAVPTTIYNNIIYRKVKNNVNYKNKKTKIN